MPGGDLQVIDCTRWLFRLETDRDSGGALAEPHNSTGLISFVTATVGFTIFSCPRVIIDNTTHLENVHLAIGWAGIDINETLDYGADDHVALVAAYADHDAIVDAWKHQGVPAQRAAFTISAIIPQTTVDIAIETESHGTAHASLHQEPDSPAPLELDAKYHFREPPSRWILEAIRVDDISAGTAVVEFTAGPFADAFTATNGRAAGTASVSWAEGHLAIQEHRGLRP